MTAKPIKKSDFLVIRYENHRRKDKNVLLVVDKVSRSTYLAFGVRKVYIPYKGILTSILKIDEVNLLTILRQCPTMDNYCYYELTDVLNQDFSKGQKVVTNSSIVRILECTTC